MESWLKKYRRAKKKAEKEALRPIDDKKVETYRINHIKRMEEEISALENRIRLIKLDLDALRICAIEERNRK